MKIVKDMFFFSAISLLTMCAFFNYSISEGKVWAHLSIGKKYSNKVWSLSFKQHSQNFKIKNNFIYLWLLIMQQLIITEVIFKNQFWSQITKKLNFNEFYQLERLAWLLITS